MKKVFVWLIACALLLAMTGVVSACDWDYCKVNGGGQVHDEIMGDITINFHAQGPCMSDDGVPDGEVKGSVHIVYHETKTKLMLPVQSIRCYTYADGSRCANLYISENKCVYVCDNGEGSKADPDTISFNGYSGYSGFHSDESGLSGNAQVRGTVST